MTGAVKLNTAGGGSVVVQPASSIASDVTVNVPSVSTTLVGTDTTQTLTNKTIQGGTVISGTAVASTSGTSIDFTGIPSWVKRVTVMLAGVSTNSTGHFFVRLGTSGGIDSTSTYKGCMSVTSTAVGSYNFTNGFQINYNYGTSYNFSGSVVLTLLDKTTNTWVMTGETSNETFSVSFHSSGSKALSSALTQVRLTTDTGTDTFDAGSVNILYE